MEQQGITLMNIDLTGISKNEQVHKIKEEIQEFFDAYCEYYADKTEEKKLALISEYFDLIQAPLGLLEKEGISALEVMQHYQEHEEKLKKREYKPRIKKCSKCIKHRKDKFRCEKNEIQTNEDYAKECRYYEEVEK